MATDKVNWANHRNTPDVRHLISKAIKKLNGLKKENDPSVVFETLTDVIRYDLTWARSMLLAYTRGMEYSEAERDKLKAKMTRMLEDLLTSLWVNFADNEPNGFAGNTKHVADMRECLMDAFWRDPNIVKLCTEKHDYESWNAREQFLRDLRAFEGRITDPLPPETPGTDLQ